MKKIYSEASLNTICTAGELSEGIIYHYFRDNDELYLLCVKECFDALTDYLSGIVTVNNVSIEVGLERYFNMQIAFFGEHLLNLGVFCSAIMNPPAHLSAAIGEITSDFDTQVISFLTTLLKTVRLRSDVTMGNEAYCDTKYDDKA